MVDGNLLFPPTKRPWTPTKHQEQKRKFEIFRDRPNVNPVAIASSSSTADKGLGSGGEEQQEQEEDDENTPPRKGVRSNAAEGSKNILEWLKFREAKPDEERKERENKRTEQHEEKMGLLKELINVMR